jgi:signal transduction histidine kinase/ligand-binding sensor domain-containing protein/DNA-binding response OmpR family regulator
MKRFFILLFVFITCKVLGDNTPTIFLSKVTPEGGVAYSQTSCIGEDEQGFIWFGTNNGLFCYNSLSINKYSHSQNDSTSIPTNRINQVYKDYTGKLWIATENGLCSYNGKHDNFITYFLKDQFGEFTGKDIKSFFQDYDSNYWFADERGVGVLSKDKKSAEYKNIDNKTVPVKLISIDDKGTIWVFFADQDIYYLVKHSNTFQYFSKGLSNDVLAVIIDSDFVWIAYESLGLECLNFDGTLKSHYLTENSLLPSNRVRSIIRTENGQIWAGTYDGIVIIKDFKIISVINQDKYSELPYHSVWSLFQDSQKNIWIGTWLGGLCFHNEYNNSITHYTQSQQKKSLNDNVISAFVQIPGKHEILIGTEGGNINHFDPVTNKFKLAPVSYKELNIGNIKSLVYYKNETLWVGTYNHGVFYKEKTKNTFSQLTPPFSTGFQALSLCATDKGIWVSDYPMGVYFYEFSSKTFTRYQYDPLDISSISDNSVQHIIQDRKGNIWFATQNGLNLLKEGSNEFIHFFYQGNNTHSISTNFIYVIFEDKDGYLWLGTNGQGLDRFNPETLTAENFSKKEGLPGNEVFSILQDKKSNIWITTDQGLCMLNPTTKNVKSFLNINGIHNNRFNPHSAMHSTTGELYFGGSNGFIRFLPFQIKKNPVPPATIITHFYINNSEVAPDQENSILTDVIGKTKSVTLNYLQNSISFRFVAGNYINSTQNHFKFRLAGFNNTWTEADINGRATFTNVPPGEYVFEVKAANNDDVWNNTPTQISICIIPPIWKRWYAYTTYFIFMVFLGLSIRKQIIDRHKLKNEIELGKIRSETEEQLHQMKLQFFTNISHEFRTPLTLIQGPVNRLLNAGSENESSNKQISLIKNNTDRLLRLVNQFLDFRKIESGKLKLSPVNSDIVVFCKNVFNCFEEHARYRSFDYSFKSDIPGIKMDFDPDKLDKILFNILSNAFKYTADGGQVAVELKSNKKTLLNSAYNSYVIGEDIADDFIEISVSDTGKGISIKNISRIFDRFFQIESNSNQGTGIGLSLSKSYILLHGGQLIVRTFENIGSVFQIYIPQYQNKTLDEKQDDVGTSPLQLNYSTEQLATSNSIKLQDISVKNPEALVLIVEDNQELLGYLAEVLQEHFRVAKARNGKEALEQTHSLFPDIVISDIMMPEIDGIELCETLKKDVKTSHIPVILLTALDTIKDQVSGLHSGADAYLAKPFNEEVLTVQVDNLLESRKLLRESFSSDKEVLETKYGAYDLDKKLLLKAINAIETNLTREDFSVEMLASELCLSRTHLHRKLKSLTNQSATEFIRYIRLKKAVKLMKEGHLKVNEIGFAVGFNSHNYFSKSFKKQFGKVPTDFMKEDLNFD